MTNYMEIVNSVLTRQISNMFPGFFKHGSTKHDHYKDFGYPETLSFDMFYNMYRRNSFANAAVERTKKRTWQGNTFLLEQKRDGSQRKKIAEETTLEKQIRLHFNKIRFWSKLAEADRRSMIGGYSVLLLSYSDGGDWDTPVAKVAGLEGLVKVEPVWAKQIKPSEWYTDPLIDKELYGTPKMWEFQEAPIDNETADKNPTQRSHKIHPSRLFVWSKDGTIFPESILSPGFNDLIDLEKIKGAGGEGFWKNAKAAPVFETNPETSMTFAEMAKAMDVSQEDLHKKMNDQVMNYQKGFDQLLMLQGMTAKTLSVSLPSPEHFFAAPLMSFAASVCMPLKILVGNQTGERASTEDSEDWDQTIMSRRTDETHPLTLSLLEQLGRASVLPLDKDWYIYQSDLTEAKVSEKIDRAAKMTDMNSKSSAADGMLTFTIDEIREVVDYEPIAPSELETSDPEDDTTEDDPNEPQGKN